MTARTRSTASRRRRPRSPLVPIGRHRAETPRIVLRIEGIGAIRDALLRRDGAAPSEITIRNALYGRTDAPDLVRAVASLYPAAILPPVAGRYGIELPPGLPAYAMP